MITAERLRELLDYNPGDGTCRWRTTLGSRALRGNIAGSPHPEGYLSIRIDRKRYLSHRLAWLFIYGEFPGCGLDHVNGQRNDNRISNLRKATLSQNQGNSRKQKNNKSGFKGVCSNSRGNKWRAEIMIDGEHLHLGDFSTPEEAHKAYCAAARKAFGEYARFG